MNKQDTSQRNFGNYRIPTIAYICSDWVNYWCAPELGTREGMKRIKEKRAEVDRAIADHDDCALATAQVTKTTSNAPVAAYYPWAEQGMN